MRLPKKMLLFVFFAGAFSAAHATGGNGTGGDDKKGEPTIAGVVNDSESKKPISGVTVSITGKGQDKKELVTDATGNFKAYQLASGEVTIVLEKKGYRTYKKENVAVKEGATLKITLEIDEYEDDGFFHPLLRMLDF